LSEPRDQSARLDRMPAVKPVGSGPVSLYRPAGVFTDPGGGMSQAPRFNL
jgi:hypothetical protein